MIEVILGHGTDNERPAEAWQYDASQPFVTGVTLPWSAAGLVYPVSENRLAVECRDGKDFCNNGDWVIREQDGSFWPCGNNVFLEIIQLPERM